MIYEIGEVVLSRAGHDKGICYAVVGKDGENLLLANGKTKLIDTPKRKKPKHVERAATLSADAITQLKERSGAFSKESGTSDSSLRTALKALGYDNSNIMIKRCLHE